MKITTYLLLLFSIVSCYSQNQAGAFKERTFLVYNRASADYQTATGDKLREIQHHYHTNIVRKNLLANVVNLTPPRIDSIIYFSVDTIDNPVIRVVGTRLTFPHSCIRRKLGNQEKLYGELKAENGKIFFYAWPYPNPNAVTGVMNSVFLEELYIDLPARKKVKIEYRALQYGALALPIKVYMASQVTLQNNSIFDANINVFIGRKWGKKSFYALPNSKEVQSYISGSSINLFLGVGKAELDNTNTTNDMATKITLPSVSPGVAFGVHYKDFGLYISTGLDCPIGPAAKRWDFAYMPWLGFGLGLGLK